MNGHQLAECLLQVAKGVIRTTIHRHSKRFHAPRYYFGVKVMLFTQNDPVAYRRMLWYGRVHCKKKIRAY
jgi:hypothetical protein